MSVNLIVRVVRIEGKGKELVMDHASLSLCLTNKQEDMQVKRVVGHIPQGGTGSSTSVEMTEMFKFTSVEPSARISMELKCHCDGEDVEASGKFVVAPPLALEESRSSNNNNNNKGVVLAEKITLSNSKGVPICIVVIKRAFDAVERGAKGIGGKVQPLLSLLESYAWVLHFLSLLLVSALSLQTSLPIASQSGGLPVGKLNFRQGMTLSEGDYIASCVGTSDRYCKPIYLMLQSSGSLALYQGASPSDDDVGDVLVWASTSHKKGGMLGFQKEFKAAINANGQLAVFRGNKEVWSLDMANDLEASKALTNVLLTG